MASRHRRSFRSLTRRPLAIVAAGGGVGVVLALAATLVDLHPDPPPASPEALQRVAAKNRDAAVGAAARMKAESEASARAADARLRAAEAGDAANPEPTARP